MFKRFFTSGMGIVGLSCLMALLLISLSHISIEKTPVAQAATTKIIVAQDGSGNYKTVQV
jgi:hypothetical protein